ncbi:MAG: hypothetical protein PHC64_03055 [Candidatus Gastranaerophilales bacterium]|nr:hypothetical protein [Candidatus Gastranaerophilales bacterium]
MSKIQSIQPNYQPNLRQRQTNFVPRQSFTGNAPIDTETVKKAADVFENAIMGSFNKLLKRLADNDGEIQSQLINAVFTTTLAPLVIAFNPFSKKTGDVEEDKRTKKYAALRQPISAIIAIAGGVGMTKPINDYLDKLGSEGFIPSIDMRVKPKNLTDQFTTILKGTKDAAEQKTFLEKFEPAELDSKLQASKDNFNHWWKGRAYRKACCQNYIEQEQKTIQEFFTALITTPFKEIEIVNGLVSIEGSGLEPRKIPNITNKTELTELVKKINLHELTFRDFMKEHFKFNFDRHGALQPHSVNSKLKSVKAMEFLRRLGICGKDNRFSESILSRTLDEIRGEKPKKVLRENIVPTTFVEPASPAHIIDAISAHTVRLTQGQVGGEIVEKETMLLSHLLHRLGYIDAESGSTKTLQEMMDKSVHAVLTELQKKLGSTILEGKETITETVEIPIESSTISTDTSIRGSVRRVVDNIVERAKSVLSSSTEKKPEVQTVTRERAKMISDMQMSDFAKNIMGDTINKTESYFKNFKGYVGILSNLVIVSITCTVLNWAYPRIVAKLFPNLLKNDKKAQQPEAQKGGNK